MRLGEKSSQVQGNRMGKGRGKRVPEVREGGEGRCQPVILGTGNVYSLWLPVYCQPLTSPFVSHPLSPTPLPHALAWGGNRQQAMPEAQ